MNRRDKEILPQERMVCHKEFMEIKSPAEKVVLYAVRIILGLMCIAPVVYVYNTAGVFSAILAALVVMGVVYGLAAHVFVATQTKGSFYRITRTPLTYFIDEKIKSPKNKN